MNTLPPRRQFFAMLRRSWSCALLATLAPGNAWGAGSRVERVAEAVEYPDGRPAAKWRLEAQDQGVVLRHGDEYLMFFSASTDRPIKRTL